MRKAKALQIKFTDQKPSEAGVYFYRAKRMYRNPERFQLYIVITGGGKPACRECNGLALESVSAMKGQFSQRIEVAK